jgi:carbonic anhydrase
MPFPFCRFVLSVLFGFGLLADAIAGGASVWRLVASDKGRAIEIDTASIQREKDGQLRVTSRMTLDKELVDIRSGGSYKYIQTTTRYDCAARTAATLQRSFVKADEEVLRDEDRPDAPAMPVRSGSLDDKVLREVCRPPGSRNPAPPAASKLADKAEAAGAALRQANDVLLRRHLTAAAKTARRPARNTPGTPAASPPPATPLPATWSYAGAGGPEHWADLRPDYQLCRNGRRQSPIDIADGVRVDLEDIVFAYQPALFALGDTEQGLVVDIGDNHLERMGKTYVLENIRFHQPSETHLAGRRFALEAQLEHRAWDGERLIVSVLFEAGAANPVLQTLLNYLPLDRGLTVAPPATPLDPGQLLPGRRIYHTYLGSLSRPPCSEGVIWVVLATPASLSPEQLAIFARLHPDNARPLQPAHGRLIKSPRTD